MSQNSFFLFRLVTVANGTSATLQLREHYPKAKHFVRDRTEALAADAAADEQLALAS